VIVAPWVTPSLLLRSTILSMSGPTAPAAGLRQLLHLLGLQPIDDGDVATGDDRRALRAARLRALRLSECRKRPRRQQE